MSKKSQNTGDQDESLASSKERLSQLLAKHKEDHENFTERVNWRISTGSLILDEATGGIAPGLVRFAGYNNAGKTPEMLEITRNFLLMENTKGMWVPTEGRFSDENRLRPGLKFVYDPKEWEVGTVFVLESSTYEFLVTTIKDLVLNNPEGIKYVFAVDSMDGLMRREDKDKPIEDATKTAGTQAISKRFFQMMSISLFKRGHLILASSQVSSEIKIDQYVKTINRGGSFSGGNALLHWSDLTIEYDYPHNGSFILDDKDGKLNDGKSKTIGRNVTVTLNKATLEKSIRKRVTYPVRFGRKPSAIWAEREVAEFLIAYGWVVKGKGAWLNFGKVALGEMKEKGIELPESLNGLNNLYAWLEDHPQARAAFLEKFRNVVLKSVS